MSTGPSVQFRMEGASGSAVMTKGVPNFVRLDPSRLDVAILIEAMLKARECRRSPVVVSPRGAHERILVG
jgi:hypothetical protein